MALAYPLTRPLVWGPVRGVTGAGRRGGFDPESFDLLADFENNVFYWGGQSRALGDLTANGDGSYDLAYNGFWDAVSGATAVVDYSLADDYVANVPSGTFFSWTDGGSTRVEFDVHNINATSKRWRGTVTPGPTFVTPVMGKPGEAVTLEGHGRNRAILAVRSGQKARTLSNNFIETVDGGSSIGALATPTKITFKRRARFNDQLLTNGTLHRVAIYRGALGQTALDVIARTGIKSPIHLGGDSFLNENRLREAIMLLTDQDGYIGYSQDGVGATSLTDLAVRFASPYTKWWKSTLVIMDGGFDGTLAEATAAIDSMVGRLGHNRWLYVQSNPQVGNSAGQIRLDWNAKDAGVLAHVGAGHYCSTLPEMQAFASADAGDVANVADGLWPPTLMSDTIHPGATIEAPNTISGINALASIIHARLVALGWA